MALTPEEETKIKKLLAVEVARAALLKKREARDTAMQAAIEQVNEQYNQEVSNLEKAVEDAQKAIDS